MTWAVLSATASPTHLVRRAEGLTDAQRTELAAQVGGHVQQAKVEVVAQRWHYLGKREEIR